MLSQSLVRSQIEYYFTCTLAMPLYKRVSGFPSFVLDRKSIDILVASSEKLSHPNPKSSIVTSGFVSG